MKEKESLLATIFIVCDTFNSWFVCTLRVLVVNTHTRIAPDMCVEGECVITASFVGLFQVIRELGYEYVSTSGFFLRLCVET